MRVKVTGCPYDYDILVSDTAVTLKTKTAAEAAATPIKIWTVGGNYAYGTSSANFRIPLARLLAQEGWPVKMTGWRTAGAGGLYASSTAWSGHTGIPDLALKTSATRAGLLEGLESYAAAANEPDFTILVCGDIDVADGVADATVLANFQSAVARIKAALPMTTVLASTIPGAGAELNAQIAAWCAEQADVECVDLASVLTTEQTAAEFDAAAALLKAKLLTLATASGKNTPSTWTRPTVTLGAENNVPAEYRAGFTRVRTIEPSPTQGFAQDLYAIPYSYAPPMRETGITKVAYYVELVRKDTGTLQALWVDMDASGPNWADVAFPVTVAQSKQQTVSKLHVWSNFGGVSAVPANDDTVEGFIEFHPINYSGGDPGTPGAIAEPWASAVGFNDTLGASGDHGCFQLMRKFADADAFPAGEVLFGYNNWGKSAAGARAIGMGTLANYGKIGNGTTKTLDWTFINDGEGTDLANFCSLAYSHIRIDFWVQYDGAAPSRAELADATWSGANGSAFADASNWTAGDAAATTLADSTLLLPEGANLTFTYVGYDPVDLSGSTLMADGAATFPDVGGFYLAGLDMGATGRFVYDPTKFTFRLIAPPTFASGAKIALTPNYAAYTKGRFLLMTWDNGALEMSAADLNALFDASSASGADVKVWAENLEGGGGRLWLDLDYATPKPRMNVLCVGDSITQGNDGTYGNWRTGLMKKLAAEGYDPVAKGFWTIHSHDICGAAMPDEWVHHSGISGQRIITGGSGGTIDQIEATLDQAGDVDFVLLKLGTNDINGGGRTADVVFPVWKELVWKILNQKPHAKFVAGTVVDIAYTPAKDAQVVAFNTMVTNAIAGGMFPAKRAYFADLYTPCYRYDAEGNYIVGSFNSATNLHPDWPGEDKMAATYRDAILSALAEDPDFELNAAQTDVPTTSGAENNVPAEYRAGFTRARVFDVAVHSGVNLASSGYVPYSVKNAEAPTENLSRVGYYIELKRRNDAQSDFHGLTRWLWVSMDAFGGRTIDDVAVPFTTVNQRIVRRLRVKTNMPGIESTAADAVDVDGWVEFWPHSYDGAESGLADAPANTYGLDWNDKRTSGNYGSMQVHRLTPGAANPAQVLFAFNRWRSSEQCEIGLGNFSHRTLESVDWTFTGIASKAHDMVQTMSAAAYEVARIEVWTASAATDPDVPGASVSVDKVMSEGGAVTLSGTLHDFGINATSADVTLEWSSDPSFATVAGSQALGTFTELGTVTNTVSGLAAGTDWYFRFTSVNGNGTAATSAVSDPYSLDSGYWRPQTAADTWTSVAWLKNDAGSPVAFNPAWTAVFDGTESTKVATVDVPEATRADQVLVTGDADYILAGAGSIAAQRLVKDGTGKLTLGAAVLAQTPDIEVRGGTVKIADDAAVGAAGAAGGTVTVKSGAQFDVNYTDATGGTDRPRAMITRNKKFVIAGDGPDGQGALISSSTATGWNTALSGGIELTGDATIGGAGRLEIRSNAVTGPTNATLTVAMNGSYGFGVNSAISVGKVVIPEEGRMKFEGATLTIDVPYGFDLYGRLRFYNANPTWGEGGITAHGANASIGNDNSTSYVRVPVAVQPDATLTLDGSATTTYENAVTNSGVIAITNGTHQFDGDLVNVGNPLISTDRRTVLAPPTVTGDSRADVSGDQFRLSGVTDWGDSALDVTLSKSGNFVFGVNNDGYGYPKFGKNKLSATVASGHTGVFYLYSNNSDTLDGITVNGQLGGFRAQGPNNGAVISCIDSNLVFSAKDMRVGTTAGRGEHVFAGPETSVSATKLQFGDGKNKNYYGMLDFAEGLLSIGADGITANWRQPGRPLFVMSGGTLRADADFAITLHGLTCDFGGPTGGGAVTFDLNGKTVKWGTGLTGGSDVTITGEGTFTPDRPGLQGIPTGKWTVDSSGTVDLRNAAGFAGGLSLAEGASATLDIAGTNMLEAVAWTWYGTPNAWDTMLPLYTNKQVVAPHLATSLTFLNRTASKIRDIKRDDTSGAGYNFFGQFYVSEAQAGQWSFTHACKTHSGFIIDGKQYTKSGVGNTGTFTADLAAGWHDFMISAYSNATDPNIGANSGSEAFKFKAPGDSDYTVFDVTTVPMRMPQDLGSRTSVRWRMYRPEPDDDPATADYATIDESKFKNLDVITNSLQMLHGFWSSGTNAPLGAAVARFDGYFQVTAETAGMWTFSGSFDDRIAVKVDGRRLFASTSSAAVAAPVFLEAGWHTFDIRTADGSTAGSGDVGAKLTDADGNVCTLRFKVGDGDYHSFDERYLPIAYSAHGTQKFEAPGLGGVTELAAGSTLENAPREGGFCPIYGTLKGAGTLKGPFRFTGEDNCWEVSGSTATVTPSNTVAFADADPQALAGLKRLKAVFSRKPGKELYVLSDALGLTAETAAGVELQVVDEAGRDYTEIFTLSVEAGRLVLRNGESRGTVVIIQ